jgi:hypothetical protein
LAEDEQKRFFYPKLYKRCKVLDSLLERRLLMKEIEERLNNDDIKKEDIKKENEEKEGNKKTVEDESLIAKCYSASCRSGHDSEDKVKCYSSVCRFKQSKPKEESIELNKVKEENIDENESINESEDADVIANCCNVISLARIIKVNGVAQIGKKIGKRHAKGQLPPCPRFTTSKGKRKSILILPQFELKRLSRSGALREVSGFSYTAKVNNYIWPYGQTPRPLFRTAWLYRNQKIESLHGVATQLRVLWANVRWDDLATKPPLSGANTITTETEVQTSEILKRRDLAPFGIRSEYLVRRIIVPIEVPSKPRGIAPFFIQIFHLFTVFYLMETNQKFNNN